MATYKPFCALRPTAALAEKISCLPYDVMNISEAEQIYKSNPDSFIKVIRSEVDIADKTDVYSENVYKKAAENLLKMQTNGVMFTEDKPCYYIYEQTMNSRVQTGIVALASVDEYENDVIKKHEHTLKEKETDRINHFTYVNAQTEPVFFIYKDTKEFTDFIAGLKQRTSPVYDFIKEDGVAHKLYVVNDPCDINYIENYFSAIDNLYIADGHHRTASVASLRKTYIEQGEKVPEEAEYIMAVSFPASEVNVMDYNRLVTDLGGLSTPEFLTQLKKDFDIKRNECKSRTDKKHDFTLYINNTFYTLTAKPGSFDGTDPLESLDANILQKNVFEKILNITDPTTSSRLSFVGGIRGYDYLVDAVNSGKFIMAIMLYPVDPNDIIRVADNNLIMPPKSTWFEPKLLSGLFIHKF